MKRFTSKNTVVISKVPEQVSDHYMLLYLNSICDSKNPVLRRKCTWSQFLALFDCDCSGTLHTQIMYMMYLCAMCGHCHKYIVINILILYLFRSTQYLTYSSPQIIMIKY